MFVDRAKIYVQSGSGGNGCVSLRREKHVPKGGPDGGDGGDGGDAVIVAGKHVSTLVNLKFQQHARAGDGRAGGSNRKHGKSGKSVEVSVPVGTLVLDADTGEYIADLTEDGQRVVLAQGGRGGRGNSHFSRSTNRTPRFAEKGEPGITRTIRLELKIVADVGLVGAPNAGKSTLLAAMSAAHPKTASYPFTTLSPNLGVVRLGTDTEYVVADIPGLIEGASHGEGLGFEFLRHVERTMVLAIVVDAATDHAVEDRDTMIKELFEYDATLLDKPRILVANKSDIPDSSDGVAALDRTRDENMYVISAAVGTGVPELMLALAEVVQKAHRAEAEPPKEEAEPDRKYVYHAPWTVTSSEAGFVVTGKKVERLAAMTDWENDEAQRYFMESLRKFGLLSALARNGAKTGDVIQIGTAEFEYVEDE